LNKVIVFDVWSSFGYFRKFYTTTTALTYPFMPRSAVEGLIAAIVGLDSKDFPKKLASSKIAVEILNKIRKLQISLSYTHSDYWDKLGSYLRHGGVPPSHITAPRSAEILCEPRYRIYFSCKDGFIMQSLATNLMEKKTIFTPYLGASSMLANFQPVSIDAEYQNISVPESKPVPVLSVLPFKDKMPKVFVVKGNRYAIEQSIPIHITADREPTGFYSAIYNPEGKEILASGTVLQKVTINESEIYVSFLPTSSET
jgi:CRISPR-associated protein Cas5h